MNSENQEIKVSNRIEKKNKILDKISNDKKNIKFESLIFKTEDEEVKPFWTSEIQTLSNALHMPSNLDHYEKFDLNIPHQCQGYRISYETNNYNLRIKTAQIDPKHMNLTKCYNVKLTTTKEIKKILKEWFKFGRVVYNLTIEHIKDNKMTLNKQNFRNHMKKIIKEKLTNEYDETSRCIYIAAGIPQYGYGRCC